MRVWITYAQLGVSTATPALIERPSAVLCAAQTRDLLVLDGELVVVRDLLVDVDRLSGVDHDLLLRLHGDDFCITVRLKEKNKIKSHQIK